MCVWVGESLEQGRMEKQETETDTESGKGHGNQKRPLPDQYFVQISGL